MGISRISTTATILKRRATVTIIIVTAVYILFNLPVFLNYTRYIFAVYVTGQDFLDTDNSDEFLKRHIWVLTYVITVALNSLINPLVYMCRMKSFKKRMISLLTIHNRKVKEIRKSEPDEERGMDTNSVANNDDHVIKVGNKQSQNQQQNSNKSVVKVSQETSSKSGKILKKIRTEKSLIVSNECEK